MKAFFISQSCALSSLFIFLLLSSPAHSQPTAFQPTASEPTASEPMASEPCDPTELMRMCNISISVGIIIDPSVCCSIVKAQKQCLCEYAANDLVKATIDVIGLVVDCGISFDFKQC